MEYNIDRVNFSIIVAFDENKGIGLNGSLPWSVPSEIKYFKETTTNVRDCKKENAVIMGRKTWDSIPGKFRPLPGRKNIVISRSHKSSSGDFLKADSLKGAIWLASLLKTSIEEIFIIGGASIYSQAIKLKGCNKIYATEFQKSYDCDTFFPEFPDSFKFTKCAYNSQKPVYVNYVYERKN